MLPYRQPARGAAARSASFNLRVMNFKMDWREYEDNDFDGKPQPKRLDEHSGSSTSALEMAESGQNAKQVLPESAPAALVR